MEQRFKPKRQSSIVTLTFNFSPGLPEGITLAGVPNVVVKPCVRPGVVLPTILYGQAILNQTTLTFTITDEQGNPTVITIPPFCAVQQPVANGVKNVDYDFFATCGTTQPPLTLTCEGTLPVIE